MRCEHVQRLVSAAMDDPLARPLADEIRAHAGTCAACRAFAEGAWRIRKASRFEVAPAVPDLAPAIMERIAAKQAAPSRARALRLPGIGRMPSRAPRIGAARPLRRAIALGVAAGLVAGFVLTGGGVLLRRTSGSAALAEEIPRRLVAAAQSLEGYRATFDIVERHWAAAVPRRTFLARVDFRAPEHFRVRVLDTTPYPQGQWTRNDLTLSTDGRAWVAVGPEPCPEGVPAPCPGVPVLQRVVHRPPFDQSAAMPTDVIVPMTVLAAAHRVQVLGPGEVGGRPAVAVALSYQDATPLFAYLRFLGSWRPFFPQDRVVVWLDRSTWFPLSYQVYPAPDAERARWAVQAGIGVERPGTPVFSATISSFSTGALRGDLFSPGLVSTGGVVGRPSVQNEGFVNLPLAELGGAQAPPRPAWTGGLRPVRYGELPRTDARPYLETVAAYSEGLAWATVTRVTGWPERRPFGVGPFAQRISLTGGRSAALYEPATSSDARRLSLHTPGGEVLVATNLPLAALERLASSLPVTSLPEPHSWRVHRWSGGVVEDGLSPVDALRRAGFRALVPSWLPTGYRAVAAEIVRTSRVRGVTLDYRRPAAELDGIGLLLYQAVGQSLPPPTGGDAQVVSVGGVPARWSPSAHQLEWTSGGTYRSLTGPAFELSTLLRMATSLGARRGA
jgi:putative zinc finger protein